MMELLDHNKENLFLMSILITHGNTQNLNNRKDVIMWKTPNIKEVSVGLEINCYACAEL